MSGLQNLSESTVQLNFDLMVQRLALTYPKNDRMNPHGINQTLSIFLTTPKFTNRRHIWEHYYEKRNREINLNT